MPVGYDKTTIEVQVTAAGVNTEQPTVQGVLSEQQIESLPVNGRNFLDLAQLEPGVQIQDAVEFGFGFKDGSSSVSFGGRFGRTARNDLAIVSSHAMASNPNYLQSHSFTKSDPM